MEHGNINLDIILVKTFEIEVRKKIVYRKCNI